MCGSRTASRRFTSCLAGARVTSSSHATRLPRCGGSLVIGLCSPLIGLLKVVPELLHAGTASGIPPRGVILRRKGAVDVLFALGKSLFVGKLFLLGRSVGY